MSLSLGMMAASNFARGFMQGMKKSDAYRQKASMYQQSSGNYRQSAANTRMAGALAEDSMRAKNRTALADMSATASENGMGESPTMMSAIKTNASRLEQNVLNQRYQTEKEAENYLYQARLAEANARRLKKKARNAFQSGLISGINSALGGLNLPIE